MNKVIKFFIRFFKVIYNAIDKLIIFPISKIKNNINEFIKNNKDSSEEIFIIGGSEIYKIFYPYAKKLYITEVNLEIDGDTFFLEIDKNLWKLDFQSPIQFENSIEFTYKNYSK